MSYWQNRIAIPVILIMNKVDKVKNQQKIEGKTIKQINKQLQDYYGRAADKVISDFEAVYLKIMKAVEDGKEPTLIKEALKYEAIQVQTRNYKS